MTGLFNLDIGGIINGVRGIVDDVHTSDEERMKASLQEKAMDVSLMQGQIQTNIAEASSQGWFKGGWRPAIGWVGAAALGYKFLLHPLVVWGWYLLQGFDLLDPSLNPPPIIDASELYPIVIGMLGFGGMRSFEKLRGKAK